MVDDNGSAPTATPAQLGNWLSMASEMPERISDEKLCYILEQGRMERAARNEGGGATEHESVSSPITTEPKTKEN